MAILLKVLGVSLMIGMNIVKLTHSDWIESLHTSSKENRDWAYPLTFCAFTTFGEFLPIMAQIGCIYLAILGNWNELYQSELEPADTSCTVHSKMFADLRNTLCQDFMQEHNLGDEITGNEQP